MNTKSTRHTGPARTASKLISNGAFWNVIEAHFFSHIHLRDVAEAELAPRGLSLAHHRTLAFIANNPGISAGRLRTVLQVSYQALNTILSHLIRSDYVEQRTEERDRRIKNLYLTSEGSRAYEASVTRQFEVVRQAAIECGPDAVRGFVAMANAMASVASREFIRPLDEAGLDQMCGKRRPPHRCSGPSSGTTCSPKPLSRPCSGN